MTYITRALLAGLCLVLVACGGGNDGDNTPVANAGEDISVNFSNDLGIKLNGSASKGSELSYYWDLMSSPDGNYAYIQGRSSQTPTFYPTQAGTYELRLTVTDSNEKTHSDNVVLRFNSIPEVVLNLEADSADVEVNAAFTIDASASTDMEGDTLTYNWSLHSAPTQSELQNLTGQESRFTFTPDVEGDYTLHLVVSDGASESETKVISISAGNIVPMLDFRVVDAEYSKALDKIIAASSSANEIKILDPLTLEYQTVVLNVTPNSVSVSPDGLFAAVGHNGWISYIDLENAKLLKTLAVSADVYDVVLAGNGYVYASPIRDQWETLRAVNLTTGVETNSSGRSIYAGTRIKLHPSGNYIYGADTGLSPSDIEKYSIQTGDVSYLYDSPYHGDYGMCGDLWMSEDGLRIFTKCGNVFRSSAVQADDMTYNGALTSIDRITNLSHSATRDEVAVIPDVSYFTSDEDADTQVNLYDYDYLGFKSSIATDKAANANGQAFATHGRFVFYMNDGKTLAVIVQADEESGLLNDYGVFLVDLD